MSSVGVAAKTHVELGASTAARWMACAGSVGLIRQLPPRAEGTGNSPHAQEGTSAHALAELALRNNMDCTTYLGTKLENWEVTEDMCENVQVFVDYCRELRSRSSQFWVEFPITLASLNPPVPMRGTADCGGLDETIHQLEVVDLKFGRGVVVEAKENEQARYYAIGFLLGLIGKFRVDTVKITIVQPRAGHRDGAVRSEVLTYLELIEFANELLSAAEATLLPDAPLVAGEHCRWCPAAGACPAQRDFAQSVAMVEFKKEVDQPPAPELLPDAVFFDILPKLDVLEGWIASMRNRLRELTERGEAPGYKLVAKRANRSWVDETEVKTFVATAFENQEDAYVMKLKSPAQIEKIIGKKNLPAHLHHQVSSGTNVVPVDDPRPEVAALASVEFAALSTGSDREIV